MRPNRKSNDLRSYIHDEFTCLHKNHYRLYADLERIDERLTKIEANLEWVKVLLSAGGVGVLVIMLILSL